MANMYPKNIAEYMPKDSERMVYQELKNQLPDSFDVFYSVHWTGFDNGQLVKSEADFIVASPDYGFLCLEVKGGNNIRVENNVWYVSDTSHGERRLNVSPYTQAEKSMYFFYNTFSNKYNTHYQGIYGAGAVFPFYSIDKKVELDNRSRECTIDCTELNNIYSKIKKMFRLWGGSSYGRRYYSKTQHNAFLELIRERVAISAAAGALVKYKEQQLSIINRVQDNYIYFLNNVRQFYIRGGAGTGKTWIAMKMAMNESACGEKNVLYLCSSSELADYVRDQVKDYVEVLDIKSFFELTISDFQHYSAPLYKGISESVRTDSKKYDAVFVDEAQDFTREWAQIVRKVLKDPDNSRLGVFYDDVQVLREDSFADGFGIDALPFLLHENIRTTANIYNWTSEKTNLGKDVIANPVEGPTPQTEEMAESGQLTLTIERIFKKYLVDESLSNHSLVILSDDIEYLINLYPDGIAKWTLVHRKVENENEISIFSIGEYKGLESDMVVYVRTQGTSENENYIAYTRAKYYLIEVVRCY